ncbi:MAG: hypothetical protein AAF587_08855 [Bacteroidota bacterium]
MKISPEIIQEFQELWKMYFGRDISTEDAIAEFDRLYQLIDLVHTHGKKLDSHE